MGLYGRSFTLQKAEYHGFNASAPQKGRAGPYTREPGSLGYNEICEMHQSQIWNIVWDDYYMAPYAYRERQWVGYDNEASIRLKVKYAKYYRLGGGMVWSIETDDFKGKCHRKKYPLLTAINEEFADPSISVPLPPEAPKFVPTESSATKPSTSQPSTTSTTRKTTTVTTTTTTTTTTPRPTTSTTRTSKEPEHDPTEGPSFACSQSGLQRDPVNCQKFHSCVPVEGEKGKTFLPYEFSCPPGTVFDEKIKGCNIPSLVEGCENSTMQVFSFFRPSIY